MGSDEPFIRPDHPAIPKVRAAVADFKAAGRSRFKANQIADQTGMNSRLVGNALVHLADDGMVERDSPSAPFVWRIL